ncbi:hypothetical protein Slin15195_G031600 [Septoria linicola]|uniref:Hypercellular protein HypA n=1 Tax=Septoria linicola TaxID=215465 RepID=A0A9Q9ASB4_9PEZI|nr:hypothetical protein Slin14017_G030610 [Septoria linicola]USW49841.1 hypothetical protein Slin15195_G031600 [Septoria linicola]
MDHFSPIAGAHVRVLVLPVGGIERSRFSLVVQRLQAEASVVSLADIAPHSPADSSHFLSPKAFAQGSLVYRFSPSAPSEQQLQLSPYELFREPLLVLGVVDHHDALHNELEAAAAYLKERHPRVVHRQLMVLCAADGESVSTVAKAVAVSNSDTPNEPTLRAAICAVSARFLVEFTTYAKALQASPTIQTPGQTARSLQRSGSLRDNERRSGSGMSSPADEGSPSRPPAKAPPLPATSFDQMPSANTVTNALERSDSRGSSQSGSSKSKGHNRTSSHDRIALQGFGSGTSADKARVRGKARVGIVLGSIYMMAGHWHDALPILVEHTTKARALSDHLWHAKGLEHAMLCMLLLAWARVDFQVPSICDPTTERTGSSTIARASIDARLAAEGMQRQIVRLSVAIPDLCRLILSLYRSHEGALELPPIVPAEASVRVCRLLTALSTAGGELSPAKIHPLVVGRTISGSAQPDFQTTGVSLPLGRQRPYSKTVIADLLAQALPAVDDGMAVADHLRLLSGIAASYGILGLERKKAITVKELIGRLTQALLQARKLGAAEMGIHPAAALSVESGSESLLSLDEDSSGINSLVTQLSAVYGANIVPSTQQGQPAYMESKRFGSENLKLDLLKELAHFCEASPDPHGVLTLTASLLRAAGPNSALDAGVNEVTNAFSREEQMHYATVIHRTVAVSEHLGLTDVQAIYWDPFLVRMVQILQPGGQRAVIDRTKLNVAQKASDQPIAPGNPLLYDPSASRPGTAARETFLLVANEASECMITLQNPFDIPVDIESLQLVTEGVELASQHQPTTLGPLRFQQITLMVTPQSVGTTKITGCQIKMQGCHTQLFPIITTSWSAQTLLTVKDLHAGARDVSRTSATETGPKDLGIEPDYVSATVIDELPTLVLENTMALESGLMLLEGESRSLELVLRNIGSIAATVFEATDTADVLRRDDEHKLKLRGVRHKRSKSFLPTTTVTPGECTTFKFRVEGKAGLSSTQANFYYQATSGLDTKHARVVSVPVIMTVNAALQVHNLAVIQTDKADSDTLLVSFDLRNAWPKSVFYECFEKAARRLEWRRESSDAPQDIKDGQLAPGEIRRVYLTLQQDTSSYDYESDAEVARTRFLDQLHVSWRVEEHSGYVDLQGLPLPSDTLDLVRGSPVSIEVHTSTTAPEISVGSYVTVNAKLKNRSNHRLETHISVELCPRSQDSRRMAFAGNLRRILGPLEDHAELSVEFIVCPLLAGQLELDVLVRPVQLGRKAAADGWLACKAVVATVQGKHCAG